MFVIFHDNRKKIVQLQFTQNEWYECGLDLLHILGVMGTFMRIEAIQQIWFVWFDICISLGFLFVWIKFVLNYFSQLLNIDWDILQHYAINMIFI